MTRSPLLTSFVASDRSFPLSISYSVKRGIILSASHLEGLDNAGRAPATVQNGGHSKCKAPPSLSPAWQREPESPRMSANVASTGVQANEGSISPDTVAPLFQLEEPGMDVTLGRGKGRAEAGEGL